MPSCDTIWLVNSKHRQTLRAIFSDPVRSNIRWEDIEKMLIGCGAMVKEGDGSRVRFKLNGIRSSFHRPHPGNETGKGAVKDLRRFLTEAGVDVR